MYYTLIIFKCAANRGKQRVVIYSLILTSYGVIDNCLLEDILRIIVVFRSLWFCRAEVTRLMAQIVLKKYEPARQNGYFWHVRYARVLFLRAESEKTSALLKCQTKLFPSWAYLHICVGINRISMTKRTVSPRKYAQRVKKIIM